MGIPASTGLSRSRGRRLGGSIGRTLTAAASIGLVLMGTATAASAQSNANQGAYRHGTEPMVGRNSAAKAACSTSCLRFGGGISGVGVTTGKERVYLIFYGSQWGTQGTNSSGYATFTGDKVGMAPDLQGFFSGLGSSTDSWSGVMTQYCQGVAVGSFTCPASAAHVAYPTGGALAGVWEDNAVKSPAASTGHQLAAEAEKAAKHFGLTTTAANRDTQFFIVSPTGLNPDNYKNQGFCAWHDYSGDTTLDGGGGAAGPLIAFTNLPYITDVGASCGAGFVNPGNQLDGITIVGGHEYAETITDQFPAGGWTAANGEENGDLCAWKTSGAGRSQNITLSTGTYAVQGTWSNSSNKGVGACAISHAIVT